LNCREKPLCVCETSIAYYESDSYMICIDFCTVRRLFASCPVVLTLRTWVATSPFVVWAFTSRRANVPSLSPHTGIFSHQISYTFIGVSRLTLVSLTPYAILSAVLPLLDAASRRHFGKHRTCGFAQTPITQPVTDQDCRRTSKSTDSGLLGVEIIILRDTLPPYRAGSSCPGSCDQYLGEGIVRLL
jgi:hypothetical protein